MNSSLKKNPRILKDLKRHSFNNISQICKWRGIHSADVPTTESGQKHFKTAEKIKKTVFLPPYLQTIKSLMLPGHSDSLLCNTILVDDIVMEQFSR